MNGVPVLLLRQVDDFCLACPDEDLAKSIYDRIGKALQLPSESSPPFKYMGLVDDYNGVSVDQTSKYIDINATEYITRVLRTHGWETPSAKERTDEMVAPLPVDAVDRMYHQHLGPADGTPQHNALQRKHGFSYRTVLGELMYAYVTCRPDIGYAVVCLSKFAAAPTDTHYTFLKNVAKYLRRTIKWGLRFHRSTPDSSLPASHEYAVPQQSSANIDDLFPSIDLNVLTAFVDASHANDLRNRRSTTGYSINMAGAAIAYRSKTQTVTATSSTEAEFIAAVLCAKAVRYLRAVLSELGFPMKDPTVLYEDNASAIKIINARHTTDRSRHIQIQWFAIQDWKDAGDITMRFISGTVNPSDDLTKPVGWILHSRHCRHLMGHYPYDASGVISYTHSIPPKRSGEGVKHRKDIRTDLGIG